MRINEHIRPIIGFFFRLFPLRAETGLRVFGSPNENSPVFVTVNYELTVNRVSRYLAKMDCYLLVAPSNGINVWCASESGDFNAHSLISVIKTSGISEMVDHKTMILPQLSAPGIDIGLIEKDTGWHCRFGPVYAEDIPQYVNSNFHKTEAMCRVKRSLRRRLDVAFGCTLPGYLLIISLIFVFQRSWVFEANLIAAPAFLLMYAFHPYIPGKEGWMKVLFIEMLLVVGLIGYLIFSQPPTSYGIGLFIGAVVIVFLLGVDFGGMDPTFKGELAQLFAKMGIRRMGLMTYKGTERIELATGLKALQYDHKKCIGCKMCLEICPVGVFRLDGNGRKSSIVNLEDCVACKACYVQCPTMAISIMEA